MALTSAGAAAHAKQKSSFLSFFFSVIYYRIKNYMLCLYTRVSLKDLTVWS
jgi:hypothetical protein